MKKIIKSIYSDSTKNFVSDPYPKKGDTISISVRLLDNDKIKDVYLRYKSLGMERVEKMRLDRVIHGLAYYQADARCEEDRFNYQFIFTRENAIYYYTQAGITNYIPDEANDFQILVDYDAPEWMSKSVFYQIMPDRFYNARPDDKHKSFDFEYQGAKATKMTWGEPPKEYDEVLCMDFYGGDLWGILEKLDYLQELGVNGIYLNPIFTSPTHHRYDALDYFEIDPALGGEEALIALSDEMHERDMRLVLDISINHTSSDAKWFNKAGTFYPKEIGAFNNPDSHERQYYFINEDGSYETWAGVETMPTLNYGSKALRDVIYEAEDSVLKKWLKPPYNIDGWRFDVADVMARNRFINRYHQTWQEINQHIKATKKDAAIIAEEWMDAWQMYDGKQWDSTMNYFQVARPLREFAGGKDLFVKRNEDLSKINYKRDAKMLGYRILQFLDKVPSQIQYQMFNLINSHDVPRLYHSGDISYKAYLGASLVLFGLPGATSIYYGDEILLDGRDISNEGARYPMDWSGDLSKKQNEVYHYYQTLARLKTQEDSLQDGGFRIIHMKGDVFAFVRFTETDLYLFSWSQSKTKEKIKLDLDLYGMQGAEANLILGQAKLKRKKDKLTVQLEKKGHALIHLG